MNRHYRIRPWAVAVWLLVWQLAAMAIGRDILLVSPWRVILRLGELVMQGSFWRAAAHSSLRIAGGFLLATACGSALAALAGRYRRVRELLAPLMLAIRSVPVASFIILALVWVSSKRLSTLIVFLMALPILYGHTLDGIDRLDPKLMEMARGFRLSPWRQARFVALPQVLPGFMTGCRLALGLCWKAGAAAEVIGMPKGSIGERLQQAKVYLDTPDLFAWTLVILALSWAFEKLALWALEALGRRLTRLPGAEGRRGRG